MLLLSIPAGGSFFMPARVTDSPLDATTATSPSQALMTVMPLLLAGVVMAGSDLTSPSAFRNRRPIACENDGDDVDDEDVDSASMVPEGNADVRQSILDAL